MQEFDTFSEHTNENLDGMTDYESSSVFSDIVVSDTESNNEIYSENDRPGGSVVILTKKMKKNKEPTQRRTLPDVIKSMNENDNREEDRETVIPFSTTFFASLVLAFATGFCIDFIVPSTMPVDISDMQLISFNNRVVR